MKQRNVFNSDDIMLRNKETTRMFETNINTY